MIKKLIGLTLLAVVTATLGACGGGGDAPAGGSSPTESPAASPMASPKASPMASPTTSPSP